MSRAHAGMPRSLWRIFRAPLLLAVVSGGGLLSALVGDGAWDVLSWLLLGGLIAVVVRALTRRG